MKISSSGIGTVASGAVASAGSNSGGKRYIWAWDFSGANSWYANSGFLGLGGVAQTLAKYGTPPAGANLDEKKGKQRGVNYDQSWAFWNIESQEEGLLLMSDYKWQGELNDLAFYIWEYSQLNRDDGKPVQISSDFVSNDWNKGKYFHLVLKTQGTSSPIRTPTTGAGEAALQYMGRDIYDSGAIAPRGNSERPSGQATTLNVEMSGAGSGIGWSKLGTYAGHTAVEGAEDEVYAGKANTTHFLMKYNDNSLSHYNLGDSQGVVYTSDTYQTGDYRVVIFNLDDVQGTHPQSPSMFEFTLFSVSPDNTAVPTDNPDRIGSANLAFMLCGMVLSNERLTDIPLPIDIHRT